MVGKILIIDDEENLVEFIENILEEMNNSEDDSYEIRSANNASDGLNVAVDFKPDVVLLDLKLPDSPGTEVLSKLKQEDKDVQVIIMTAHASVETAIKSVREEAYDYIEKPLPSRGQLQTIVKNAIQRRQLLKDKKNLLLELSNANEALEEANKALQDEKEIVDQKLQEKVQELSRLNKFTQALLRYNDLSILIDEIPGEVIEVSGANGVLLILKKRNGQDLEVKSLNGEVNLSRGDNVKEGEKPFGLIHNEGPWETDEYICSPLKFSRDELGVLALKKDDEKISPDFMQTICGNISIALHNAMLYDSLKASYIEGVLSLIMVEESVKPEIKAHSERVGDLSTELAQIMNLSDRKKKHIRYAALLHDLGKISEDDAESTMVTRKILKPLKFLKRSRKILEHLNENYDGSGEPDGLKAEDIPVGSRIIKIANRVDEILQEKDGSESAVEELKKDAGSKYDPNIVKLTERIL